MANTPVSAPDACYEERAETSDSTCGATISATGCGAAWLARVLWVHEVPGSNPGTPTVLQRFEQPSRRWRTVGR